MEIPVRDQAVPETKRKLLDASIQLMLAKGYTATTVDEICDLAKVTKGSFFHYFESKEAIAKAAIEVFFNRQSSLFAHAPFRQKPDALERVFGLLDLLAQMATDPHSPKSCLIGNFAQELSATHPEIRHACQNVFTHSVQAFAADLTAAKKHYKPKMDFDPESVAQLYLSVVQGSMVLSKAKQDAKPFQQNIAHLRRYVEFLFNRTNATLKG